MFQFLNSTWASTGIGKTSDPRLQAIAGGRYIASRYGSPVGAWNFWQGHHWYDNGGYLMPGATLATNRTGRPERVLGPSNTVELGPATIKALARELAQVIPTRVAVDDIHTSLRGKKNRTRLPLGLD
jgi:SLT domain-containing protein